MRKAALACPGHEQDEQEDETLMKPHAGDKIVVESEKVAQPSRAGVIEEVLQDDPPRVRVRWEDGHTSILTPSAGAARVIHAKTRAKA
jgi:archaeosine-15-forming tRNA-guanine transglycosylase